MQKVHSSPFQAAKPKYLCSKLQSNWGNRTQMKHRAEGISSWTATSLNLGTWCVHDSCSLLLLLPSDRFVTTFLLSSRRKNRSVVSLFSLFFCTKLSQICHPSVVLFCGALWIFLPPGLTATKLLSRLTSLCPRIQWPSWDQSPRQAFFPNSTCQSS